MSKADETNRVWIIWAVAVCAFIAIIGFWIWNWNHFESLGKDDRGTFGDMFGISTSLFTGVTVIGLVVTILLQQEDIRLARKENEASSKRATKDREENHFFQLMQFQQNTLAGITGANGSYGRIILRSCINDLKPKVARATLQENLDSYKEHIKNYSSYYFHFIKTLEVTLMFIHDSTVFDNAEKKAYMKTFKSQLSSTELTLWAYNLYLYNSNDHSVKQAARLNEIFEDILKNDLGNHSHFDDFNGNPLEKITR